MSSYSSFPTSALALLHNHNHAHAHSHPNNRRRAGGPGRVTMNNPHMQKHHHHHHQQLQQQQQQQQHQMLRSQQVRLLPVRDLPEPVSAPQQPTAVEAYRECLEKWISFDLEDDMEFCPNLVADDDDWLSHTSSSDHSSLASSSPGASPTQQPQTVVTGFLNVFTPAFMPSFTHHTHHASLQIHQPAATRAIAIIDPTTGIPVSSPSPSASPNRLPRNANINMGKW